MTDTELHVVFGTGPVGLAVMGELVREGKSAQVIGDPDQPQRATPLRQAIGETVCWYRRAGGG